MHTRSRTNIERTSKTSSSGEVFEPPLDYSFKCLTSIIDCLEEEPRDDSRKSKSTREVPSPQVAKVSSANEITKRRTNAVRLSNNVINEWKEFSPTLEKLVVDPYEAIEWIDLSFNDMTTIDKCLLQYRNLKVLYLHGNALEKLSEVDKLLNLPLLKSLTLHGNPIEEVKGYRQYVLSRIPQLKNFDFSGVTKSDRACSDTWSQMSKRQKQKLT